MRQVDTREPDEYRNGPQGDQHAASTPGPREQDRFGQGFAQQARATRPERHANRQLLRACHAPGEEQTRDVRARHEQHETHRAQHQEQRRAHPSHEKAVQRLHDRNEPAVNRIGLLQTARHEVQGRQRACRVGAGSASPEYPKAVLACPFDAAGTGKERPQRAPELGIVGVPKAGRGAKVGRHHTDNRVGHGVERDLAPEHLAVAAEA